MPISQRSYDGNLQEKHVRIGAQRLLLAATTASSISQKITDITNPPTGWRNTGSLKDHNLEVTGSQEIFKIMDGIPEGVKFQERVGVGGVIKAVLNEWSFLNLWEALGRPAIVHTLGSGSDTVGSGTTTTTVAGVTYQLLKGTDVSDFEVNDVIVVDADADCASSPKVTTVIAVDSVGNTLTVDPPIDSPTAGDKIKEVTWTLTNWGDNGTIVKLQAAAVFDAKSGEQVIHHFPNVAMVGEYNPGLAVVKQNSVLNLQLEAYLTYDETLGKSTICRPQVFHKNA